MNKITKEQAVSKIHACAVLYGRNLLGKNVLFITGSGNNFDYFETAFHARNFLHFTGISTGLDSNRFFSATYSNKLSTNDIKLPLDGTTELKLSVLPTLMSIHTVAKMVGDYDNSKSLLITDKMAGTVTSAMGFIIDDTNYYVPNTVIKEDIRNLTIKPQRKIIATLIKTQKEEKYSKLTYLAKGYSVDDIIKLGLKDKVDLSTDN